MLQARRNQGLDPLKSAPNGTLSDDMQLSTHICTSLRLRPGANPSNRVPPLVLSALGKQPAANCQFSRDARFQVRYARHQYISFQQLTDCPPHFTACGGWKDTLCPGARDKRYATGLFCLIQICRNRSRRYMHRGGGCGGGHAARTSRIAPRDRVSSNPKIFRVISQ